MDMAPFEFLDHTADVQIHCWGKNLNETFSEAFNAMMAVMLDNLTIEHKISRKIIITAPDKQILFVDFLSEFLTILDIEELIFNRVIVKKIEYQEEVDQYYLEAEAYGEKYDPKRHIIKTEIKAVTFSFLKINEKENKAEILFVLDI